MVVRSGVGFGRSQGFIVSFQEAMMTEPFRSEI